MYVFDFLDAHSRFATYLLVIAVVSEDFYWFRIG